MEVGSSSSSSTTDCSRSSSNSFDKETEGLVSIQHQYPQRIPSKGVFQCHFCGLMEKYHYYGRKPPFAKGFVFLEDGFIAEDPFAPPGEGLFLFLGSMCSVCKQNVCQSQDCSIYYSKRYCLSCAQANFDAFPSEMKKGLSKLKFFKNMEHDSKEA